MLLGIDVRQECELRPARHNTQSSPATPRPGRAARRRLFGNRDLLPCVLDCGEEGGGSRRARPPSDRKVLDTEQESVLRPRTAVLGPDGKHWYFVHHHLDAQRCQANNDCRRDVWVSPMELADHGDGNGDVYLEPRFPAEDPTVEVVMP